MEESDVKVNEKLWWEYLTLAVIFVVLLVTESPGQDWGGDFSQYIYHAISMIDGLPYTDARYIYNGFAYVAPPAYPPLFPLLLAPMYAVFGIDWLAFKSVVIASFCLALVLLVSLREWRVSRAYRFALIIIIAFNPLFWGFKSDILSDFSFMMVCMLTLFVLYGRYVKEADRYVDNKRKKWVFAFVMGLFLYLPYATREIGIVFVPAVLCFELFHYRKITIVTCIAVLVFAVLAGVQSVGLKSPEGAAERDQRIAELAVEREKIKPPAGHADFISVDVSSIIAQGERYLAELRSFWPENENGFASAAGWIAFSIVLLFALAGYVKAVINGPGILEIFIVGYIAILVLFSGFQGLRYFVPIIPFFLLYAFKMHEELLLTKYRNIMIAVAALFVSTTAFVYASNYDTYFNKQNRGITTPEAIAFFEYVENSTPEDAVFIFSKPRVLSLLTRRDASDWPGKNWLKKSGPDFMVKYMNAIGADYLVCSNIGWDRLGYPLESACLPEGKFEMAYSNDNFQVYKLDRAGKL
jgi:hypothetical protein